uniref:Formin GTPase-binding domain-containing protein n=1 Tax=Astyanax mexicanus TaxID=7994 RepID=A0A3B1KH78_ASTMX
MENYYHQPQRYDSSSQGRDSKSHRKKGLVAGGTSAHTPYGTEEGEKKPKFLDRFASIRIPGSKKERPNLAHVAKYPSPTDGPSSLEFEELSSKITSEKEILALFEKMMEDMNLNEDKRGPLREKDLSTKREMVLRYVVTAAKTGSLKSSHQISPQEFLTELKSGATDEKLFTCLDSLRVSLTSNPVRAQRSVCFFFIARTCSLHHPPPPSTSYICVHTHLHSLNTHTHTHTHTLLTHTHTHTHT